MAVPAGIEYVDKGYDVSKLNEYLDWFNILSYDYHSAFEPAVDHHAPLLPLLPDDEYNFASNLNIVSTRIPPQLRKIENTSSTYLEGPGCPSGYDAGLTNQTSLVRFPSPLIFS